MCIINLEYLSVKDKAKCFFFTYGFEISNVIINKKLDMYHLQNDKEKEINFWLDVKNELIIINKR